MSYLGFFIIPSTIFTIVGFGLFMFLPIFFKRKAIYEEGTKLRKTDDLDK
jgi:hypothetical protein